jgi:hypothetical protein
MRLLVITSVLAFLLIAPVGAKGPTTRIVIKDLDRGSVSEITDRSVLDQFHVWPGKGTYSGPPDHTTEGTQGFIVDWQAGVVEQRPSQLRRFEVSFYVAMRNGPGEELAYVVLYEGDPSTRQGYVYFPGRSDEHFRLNVRSIHRGVEGQWLRANHQWQAAIAKLPVAR